MNCINSFISNARSFPDRVALWSSKEGITTFSSLYASARAAQTLAKNAGVVAGDYALIFGVPSRALYAEVIGLLGLGSAPIFIEPWMSIQEIEEIIKATKPKIYLTNFLGRIWGMRIGAIRKIPKWISHRKVKGGEGELEAVEVSKDQTAFITFTTGTTGRSKGVVKSHGVLEEQSRILSKYLTTDSGVDLCVLPNFVLLNLSHGKSSLFLKSPSRKEFEKIPKALNPSSVTTGPGFLKSLIENSDLFPTLNTFHIGGALAECSLYELGFKTWPKAKWIHVYGSSEVEPVALFDAKEAIQKCRERGFHQTLYLGKPIQEIGVEVDNGLLWVTGSHVSPLYFGNHEANSTHKKIDSKGSLWHQMGDRVLVDKDGWWYQGRASQPLADFQLEQEISTFLKTDDLLVFNNTLILGKISVSKKDLLSRFPTLKDVIHSKIYRDRRHRARIDRVKTVKKGALCLNG